MTERRMVTRDELVKALDDAIRLMNLQAELADCLEEERPDLEAECTAIYSHVTSILHAARG